MILFFVIGNVAAPILSGITLFIFAAYFVFTKSVTTRASRYFVTFLISFGIFVIFRPVQLYLGPHPYPRLINNLRSLIFLGCAIPALTLANLSFKSPVKRRLRFSIWGMGLLLALIFIVFNILGVRGSRISYFSVGLPAYEPYLPEHFPPFYSREITIATYLIGGLMIGISGFNLLNLKVRKNQQTIETPKKYLYFGMGSLILGISFILGGLLKYWWMYYFASVFSTLFAGYGIVIDIREIMQRVDRTLPYVKGELSNLIRFESGRKEELVELFHILELNTRINTFVIMEYKGSLTEGGTLDLLDRVIGEVEPLLDEVSGEGSSLIMPIGRYKLGLCLYVPPGKKGAVLEFCESLLNHFDPERKLTLNFGIGRTGGSVLDLSDSYHDAVTAQAYSSFFHKSQIIHINDVEDISQRDRSAVYDMSDLSIALKTGNIKASFAQFHLYYAWMVQASRGDLENLKMRALHFFSSITQDVMTIGVPGLNIAERTNSFYKTLLDIEDQNGLRLSLIRILEETVNAVSQARKKKLSRVVLNTRKYIDDHISENLSGIEIAEVMEISHSYLINIFKKETGFSLNDYINRQRIARAKVLLSTTEEAITEIAYLVGFNDSNYFSTAFRKSEGMPPSVYRKAQKIS